MSNEAQPNQKVEVHWLFYKTKIFNKQYKFQAPNVLCKSDLVVLNNSLEIICFITLPSLPIKVISTQLLLFYYYYNYYYQECFHFTMPYYISEVMKQYSSFMWNNSKNKKPFFSVFASIILISQFSMVLFKSITVFVLLN